MAKVLGSLKKGPDESTHEFKQRCCDKLREVADNSIDPKAFAFGRFAKVNGILEVSCLWGLAYPDLPAEDCYIASYTKGECKSNYLQIQEG